MSTDVFVDHYQTLSIPETANEEEIKKAIVHERRTWTARTNHADVKRAREAEDRVRNISEAEKVLLNADTRKAFDNARRTAPKPSAPPIEGDGNWVDRAQQYLDAGNPYSAHYAAREAITTNGSDPRAWSLRAHSSFLMGNWNDSEYEFNEAIRLKPDQSEYHFELGSVYQAARRWNDALRKYEEALRIDPGNAVYKTSIAAIYLEQGDAERALSIMEDVVKSNPGVPAFDYYLAWALIDSYDTYATTLKDGSFRLTSPEQVAKMKADMERVRTLSVDDPTVKLFVDRRLKSVATAETVGWEHSDRVFAYVVAIAVGLLMLFFASGAARFLGLLIAGGIGYIYYMRHHMSGWKANATQLKKAPGLVAKWGIGSRA